MNGVYRHTTERVYHCGVEMIPADSSMTGYWPYVPQRCPKCGAIEYARMKEYPHSQQSYDSTQDTLAHVEKVRGYLLEVEREIVLRGAVHDQSKLESPEKEVYDKLTPSLRQAEQQHGYGSNEYESVQAEMGDIPKRHYERNRHHPEHFADGINEMNLMDIVEMLADWKAATERTPTGDLVKSIDYNVRRYGISDQLAGILRNTARDLGWT